MTVSITRLIRIAMVTGAVCLLAGGNIPGDFSLNKSFSFIGLWRGPTGGFGSVILIAPSWLITATHVAKLKAEDPSRHIEVSFDNGTKCEVSEVFMAEGVDVSLVHLKTPMKGVPPAGLLSQTILDKDGLVEFTLAGHSGGLHCHPHRKAKGEAQGHVRQIAAKDDPNPGRGGDSGGAWAVEDAATGLPVVFATIHGGGLANQLAPLREWIDGKMKASGEAAKWVACKLPVATTQPK